MSGPDPSVVASSFADQGGVAPPPWIPWAMFQSWRKLLFMHWEVPADIIRPLVPKKIDLDDYNGKYFITMIPMYMSNIHIRDYIVPVDLNFPEINFRTYVRVNDVPGVYFFSIDAGNWLASTVARDFYELPYVKMNAEFTNDMGTYTLTSDRPKSRHFNAAIFDGTWTPKGVPSRAKPGERLVLPGGAVLHVLHRASRRGARGSDRA